MIKNILLSLLSSVSLFSGEVQSYPVTESEQTCCQVEEFDISDWITMPISFGSINGDSSKQENLTLSFPSEPTFIQGNGSLFSPYSSFTVTDDEKMVYTITCMDLTGGNYSSMHDGVDFLVQCLYNSSSKQFLGATEFDPDSNRRLVFWSEGNQLNTLEFVQGTHFTYVLGTTAHSELYTKDLSTIKEESEEFKTLFRNGAKARSFFKSFKILN